MSYVSSNSENEGGNFEQLAKIDDQVRLNSKDIKHQKNISESSSDIT